MALTAGCASLPPPQQRTDSSAFADTAGTRIGQAIAPLLAAHPGRSGIHAMPDAYDAFAARVAMAARAQRSIDAQYFIWHDDQVGMLMFQALWQAAERGVRVRLLLDDGGTGGIDAPAGDARRAPATSSCACTTPSPTAARGRWAT